MVHLKFIRQLLISLMGNFRKCSKKRGRPPTCDQEDMLDGKLHIFQPNEQGKHNDCLVCSNWKIKGGR